MSAGVELPKSILVHGYVTVDGQKMSKSIGNVVDPIAISAKYGQDAIRYYLLKEISTFQDGDFSEKALKDALNNELAGNLGNFINRTFTFISSRMGGSIKELEMDEGRLVIDEAGKIAAEVDGLMARCQLGMALMKIMEISNIGNRYLQSNEPWKLADVDERAAREVLFACATLCRMIGILIYPFMPGAAERMLGYIGEKPSGYGKAVEIPASFSIKEHGILFKKIE
jgi:methionyl-tRNA synthetase